ncbi:hypothetical protein HGRIS_000836 [Hohenbuehelia grisea]|uniref:Uncharacterized protein n=1 Tax=Hohenbuehelia grisea TaxID=104357 RepID=A0ABR3IPW8_9AGAR
MNPAAASDVEDITETLEATSISNKQTIADWLASESKTRIMILEMRLSTLDSDSTALGDFDFILKGWLPSHLLEAYVTNRVLRPLDELVKIRNTHPKLVDFIPLAYMTPDESIAGPADPLRDPAKQRRILAQAFAQPLQGGIVVRFLDDLGHYGYIYDPNEHYGRVIALTQASGEGKSYLVFHLTKKRITVSICFRGLGRNMKPQAAQDGWPPQDTPICVFFAEHMKEGELGDHFKAEELAGVFLGALFHVMTEILGQFRTLEGFNSQWEYASKIREDSFERVRLKAEALLSQLEKDNSWKDMRTKFEMPTNEPKPGQKDGVTGIAWYDAIFKTVVEPYLVTLLKLRKKLKMGEEVIIALDECTQINNFLPVSKPENLAPLQVISLVAVQRIIKACERYPCWFLLLDTKSAVSVLHPPRGEAAPSYRLREAHNPLPVWPYFEYDLMVDKGFEPEPTPQEALSLRHQRCYGRPYWWAIQPELKIIPHAIPKLLGRTDTFNVFSEHEVFAVLSARVLLTLAVNQAATYIASEGVRSHMRILRGVINRSILWTSAPSEPILAIAAATSMLPFSEKHRHTTVHRHKAYDDVITTFVNKLILQKEVIEKGTLGELISRLFLTIARDAALGCRPFVDLSENITTVSLHEFFVALLGDSFYEGKPEIVQELKQYVINFTHFVQISHNISLLTPTLLYHAWFDDPPAYVVTNADQILILRCRGVALQCVFGQPIFDILLVAYDKDYLAEPFDAQHCYAVSVQVKCKAKAAEGPLVRGLTVPFLFNGDKLPKSMPPNLQKPKHLVMFMDLGTDTDFKPRPPHPQVRVECEAAAFHAEERKDTDKQLPWHSKETYYFKDPQDEPKRWCINVRGRHGYSKVKSMGSHLLSANLWGSFAGSEFPKSEALQSKQLDTLREQVLY